jgi:hypothetical protein
MSARASVTGSGAGQDTADARGRDEQDELPAR